MLIYLSPCHVTSLLALCAALGILTTSQLRRIAERLWGLSTASSTTVRSPMRWLSTGGIQALEAAGQQGHGWRAL